MQKESEPQKERKHHAPTYYGEENKPFADNSCFPQKSLFKSVDKGEVLQSMIDGNAEV